MSWASQTFGSGPSLGNDWKMEDPTKGLSMNSFNAGNGGGFMGIPGGVKDGLHHLWGNDPWGVSREWGIGAGTALATAPFGGPMVGPMLGAGTGFINKELYSGWQKRDRQLKDQRNYHAMATRNRDLASAGVSGVNGGVATAATGSDVSSVLDRYAQARAAAMQAYEAQIMDQFSMFGEMAGMGAGSTPNPYGNQG